MGNKTFLISLFLLHTILGWSQYVVTSNEELVQLTKVPQEKVYMAHTGPLLFSGEYLYYGFYCFNAQNNRQSNISRMGYVALVNEEKEYVFEQKIRLERGLGQGEYFISTQIPSGNYKLLGYTQWMKNNGLSQVFQENITIVNPYMVDQSVFLKNNSTDVNKEVSPSETANTINSPLQLEFEKKEFGSREQVKFSLRNYKGQLGFGTYTVKVKKKEELSHDAATRAEGFAISYLKAARRINKSLGDSIFLPEQRGELLFGSVRNRITNEPAIEVPVVVSFPGKEFILKLATTDASGNFYSYLKKDYKTSQTVLQIVDEEVDYDIELKEPYKLDVSNLEFGKFQLNESMKANIEKRSIYNQIENQFFQLKPDSVLLSYPIDPFDGSIPEVVNLDDYTRFRTFQETLVELLPYAGYRIGGKEKDYIRIGQDFEKVNTEYNDYPAIVLIDGVYIPNHEAIKEYDARKIKSISLIQDQFQLGNKLYQGMLSVETFDGDYVLEHTHKNALKSQIDLPDAKKNYYQQRYTAENLKYERIPDYRTLLFWRPSITIDNTGLNFDFFTSDVKGEYEVVLDGFTTYGKPISLRETFMVN
jgi:hypothetical protein